MDNFEDVYGRSRMMIGDPQNKEMIAWIDFAGLSVIISGLGYPLLVYLYWSRYD